MSNGRNYTIRTRGGSGIASGEDRARAFIRQHPEVTNARGVAKMFRITVAEAKAILAERNA
jgi:hypothetical protein